MLNGRDVSERKAFEEQLAHQAFHDPVTNLANRALFNERVRHAIGRARREQRELGVMFLDLDDFKTVNDSLGHGAGDAVLLEVAKRLSNEHPLQRHRRALRRRRVRVLLEDVDSTDTRRRGRRADPRGSAPAAELAGKQLVVRASLGISIIEPGPRPSAPTS